MKTKITALILSALVCVVLALFAVEVVSAIETPEPPSDLKACESWEINEDIPANVTFTCNGQKLAFPVKAEGPAKDCDAIQVMADEVHLITISDRSWRYIIAREPHAFMREARWLSMYGKTWGKK